MSSSVVAVVYSRRSSAKVTIVMEIAASPLVAGNVSILHILFLDLVEPAVGLPELRYRCGD